MLSVCVYDTNQSIEESNCKQVLTLFDSIESQFKLQNGESKLFDQMIQSRYSGIHTSCF